MIYLRKWAILTALKIFPALILTPVVTANHADMFPNGKVKVKEGRLPSVLTSLICKMNLLIRSLANRPQKVYFPWAVIQLLSDGRSHSPALLATLGPGGRGERGVREEREEEELQMTVKAHRIVSAPVSSSDQEFNWERILRLTKLMCQGSYCFTHIKVTGVGWRRARSEIMVHTAHRF